MNDVVLKQPSRWQDYWALGKPRVVVVMLVCALVGALLARPVLPDLGQLTLAMLGIALASMGAAAFNHLLDQRFDQLMARTRRRPFAQQRLSTWQVSLYASALSLSGVFLLAWLINPLTAMLTAASLLGYALVYTAFLKHATPQNITIGGLAGAAPPLLGWTAVTGQLEGNAVLLVLIIFAWTPAHFWVLAIHRCEEYRHAGVPMLPVTHGDAFTRLQVWLYAWLTVAVTLLPFVTAMSCWLYLLLLLPLNARWIWFNWRVYRHRHDVKAPMQAFWFSIRYILWLFGALLLDHFVRF
ncbi:protoheme IX farnesyltransferase [Bacterioplanes sanyensis]|uniref:Protoheme IX farnesyltransferase n=1 Tax=Bacterioplanes sanyensis TaxID=1249553 RepID=A0A222FLM5_9GAMM|nr:heme o synthase [Bacterioplanes sanyensis]ASP39572.1 protoheme IX farnesyltransferase [Bacterioplanes sanyensis]